jgi:hypothetical protein
MNPTRRRFLAALAALAVTFAWAATGCAQHATPSGHMALPTVVFPADSAWVDVPFTENRNHIVVPVRLEGSGLLQCVLDTGARGTVIFGDSLVRTLGLTPAGEAKIQGAGGGGQPVHGTFYQGVHFAIGGLAMSNAMVVTLPDSSMRTNPLKGRMAMGRGLLERSVVEIDWETHRVRFHDPARFQYSGTGVSVPLTFGPSGEPYVQARVALAPDSAFDVSLVLDTGASHALQLQPGGDPRIRVPAGAAREKIGQGATGQVWGVIGRAATFEIGGVTFRDMPVTFPDGSLGLPGSQTRQGNLGSGLLRRFRVILDYGHARMILEPGPHVTEPIVLPPYGGAG